MKRFTKYSTKYIKLIKKNYFFNNIIIFKFKIDLKN